MNTRPTVIGFFAGFAVASVVGLAFVVPMFRESWRVNVDCDVHRGRHRCRVNDSGETPAVG